MYDADIRRALKTSVAELHKHDPDTKIVDELGLRQGKVRVDVAVVNGVLKGYEIKSAADTLRRLPTQIEVYSEVLDYATLVLADEHRVEGLDLVPAWWEIVVAVPDADRTKLEQVRGGSRNPNINKRALAELLWHADALELLRSKNAARGLSARPRAEAWDRVVECCTVDEVRDAVRSHLKGRPPRRSVKLRP